MIDTIFLEIKERELDVPISFKEEVSCKININDRLSSNEKIVGHLENMLIEINGSTLKIRGSLSKWYKGNNVYGITFKEVKEAITDLENVLGVPLERAKITRLDIADSFNMKYKAELYIDHLHYLNGYIRNLATSNCVYFVQKNKSKVSQTLRLCFYDKDKELKDKKDIEGKLAKGSDLGHLLRYELRIKSLRYLFGREIRCSDLFSEFFYTDLIDLWFNMYDCVKKERKGLNCNFPLKFNGLKEFQESCERLCVGAFNMQEELNIAYLRGEVTAQNKTNVLKRIKELENSIAEADEVVPLIKELDKKMLEAYDKRLCEIKNFNKTLTE